MTARHFFIDPLLDAARRAKMRLNMRLGHRARRALRGRTYLVTGATGAIGEATVKTLVSCGASVLMHGRSDTRLNEATARLEKHARHGARLHRFRSELGDRNSVAEMIDGILHRHPALDGIINNAAIGYQATRSVDVHGIESLWSTNVVAPWQLSCGLATLLAKSDDARILNIVSGLVEDIGPDLMLETGYEPVHAYARSKQALIVATTALAENLAPKRIAVFAVDPGTVDTPMAAGFVDAPEGMSPTLTGELFAKMVGERGLREQSGQLFSLGRARPLPDQAQDKAFRDWMCKRVDEMAGARTTAA